MAAQLPDLTILTLQAPSAFTNSPNPVITIQWGVTNQGGPVPSDSYWSDTFYISTNNLLDATATRLSSWGWSANWLATGSYGRIQLLDLPITNSGIWYLHFKIDDDNRIAESNETNNVATVRFTATILRPDLKPLALVTPASFTGPPFPYLTLAWGVTNQGAGPANGFAHPWSDALFLSTNAYRDGTEQTIDCSVVITNILAPGACYWVTNRVRLPAIQSAEYHLILQTDPGNILLESDPNNNTISVPLHFQATPPDLAPILFQAPADFTGSPNPRVTFVWGVTNQGTGPAIGQIFTVYGTHDGWLDGFYVSTNAVLDASAARIDFWEETNALAAGASYRRTNTFTLPVVASGTYYLFLVTDEFNGLQESNFSNNTATRRMTATIQSPDLAPLPLRAPTVVTGVPGTLVPIIFGVTNQGVALAVNSEGGWCDRLELWTGPGFPGSSWCELLGQWQRTTPLPSGGCYWLTNTFAIPPGGGEFSLVFKTDDWGNLFESNETNNIVSCPFTVMIPARLESPVLGTDGAFWANALATLGFNYTLQASSNLVNWVDVSTFSYASWPTMVTEPAAAGHRQRFYRLVPAPTEP
jgi:hypothetical protein